MVFSNHGVNFPVTDSALLIDNFRPLINAYGINNLPSTVYVITPFSVPFSFMPQMIMQVSASFLVIPYVATDGFMTDSTPSSSFNRSEIYLGFRIRDVTFYILKLMINRVYKINITIQGPLYTL